MVMGIFLVAAPHQFVPPHDQPPAFMGWFFIAFGAFFITAGWAFAFLLFLVGTFIALRRHYIFCFVMSCIECMFMPFGTVLGAFTIIDLVPQSVKNLFTPRPS